MKTIKLSLLALSVVLFASDSHCATKRPLPADNTALKAVYATGSNNMMASKNLTVADCNGFLLGAVNKLDIQMVQTVLNPPKTAQALGKAPQDNLRPDEAGIDAALTAIVAKRNVDAASVASRDAIYLALLKANPSPSQTVMNTTLINIIDQQATTPAEKNALHSMIAKHVAEGNTRPIQAKVDEAFKKALLKGYENTVRFLLNTNNYNPNGMKLSQSHINEILLNEVEGNRDRCIDNVGMLINKNNTIKPDQVGMDRAFVAAAGLVMSSDQLQFGKRSRKSGGAQINIELITKFMTNEELRPDQEIFCKVIRVLSSIIKDIPSVISILNIQSTLTIDTPTADLVFVELMILRDTLSTGSSTEKAEKIQEIDALVLKIVEKISKNVANLTLPLVAESEIIPLFSALCNLPANNRPDDTVFDEVLLSAVEQNRASIVSILMDRKDIKVSQAVANEAFSKASLVVRDKIKKPLLKETNPDQAKINKVDTDYEVILEKMLNNEKTNPDQLTIDQVLLRSAADTKGPIIVKVIMQNTSKVKPSVSAVNKALIESIKSESPVVFGYVFVNNKSTVQPDTNSIDQALLALIEKDDGQFNQHIQTFILNASKVSQAGVNTALLKAVELGKLEMLRMMLNSSGITPDQASINDALLKATEADNLQIIELLLPMEGPANTYRGVKPDQATRKKAFSVTFGKENEGNEAILKKLKIDQAGINTILLGYVNAAKADSKTVSIRKIEKLLSGTFDLMIDQITLDRALTKKDDTNESNVLLHKGTLEVLLASHVPVKASAEALNTLFAEAALQAKPEIVSYLLTSNKPTDAALVDVLKQVAQKLTTKVEKEMYAAYKEVFKRIISADISIDQTSYNTLFELCATKSKELMDLMLKSRLKPSATSVATVLQELAIARGEKAFEEKFGAAAEEKITLLLASEMKPEAAVIKAALDAMDARFKIKQDAAKKDTTTENKTKTTTAEGKYTPFKTKLTKEATLPKAATAASTPAAVGKTATAHKTTAGHAAESA